MHALAFGLPIVTCSSRDRRFRYYKNRDSMPEATPLRCDSNTEERRPSPALAGAQVSRRRSALRRTLPRKPGIRSRRPTSSVGRPPADLSAARLGLQAEQAAVGNPGAGHPIVNYKTTTKATFSVIVGIEKWVTIPTSATTRSTRQSARGRSDRRHLLLVRTLWRRDYTDFGALPLSQRSERRSRELSTWSSSPADEPGAITRMLSSELTVAARSSLRTLDRGPRSAAVGRRTRLGTGNRDRGRRSDSCSRRCPRAGLWSRSPRSGPARCRAPSGSVSPVRAVVEVVHETRIAAALGAGELSVLQREP
jgi:hypothetical protein